MKPLLSYRTDEKLLFPAWFHIFHRWTKQNSISRNFLVVSLFFAARRRDAMQSAVIATTSRLSVCLSVMLRYRDHICWNFSKIISQLVSLQVLQTPTSRIYFTGTPLNFDWNSGGVWKFWKGGFWHTKALISLKRGKIGPRLLLRTNRKSRIRAFLWCQNLRPLVTLKGLKGHYALCFKTVRQDVVSYLFLVSYSIRF